MRLFLTTHPEVPRGFGELGRGHSGRRGDLRGAALGLGLRRVEVRAAGKAEVGPLPPPAPSCVIQKDP